MTIRIDTAEAVTGAAFTFVVGVFLNNYSLPIWGCVPTVAESFQIALLYFSVSSLSRLAFRRLFRWLS